MERWWPSMVSKARFWISLSLLPRKFVHAVFRIPSFFDSILIWAAPLALIWTPLRVATLRECIDSGMVFNESRYKWLSFCFDSFFVPYLKFLATGPNKNGTSDDVLARIVGILCKDAFHTRFDHNLIRARCFDTGKTTHFRSAPLFRSNNIFKLKLESFNDCQTAKLHLRLNVWQILEMIRIYW